MEELIKVLILMTFAITFGSISIALSILVAFIGLDKELQKITSSYQKSNNKKSKDNKSEELKNV